MDDVLDGMVGFMEGRFEFAIGPRCFSRLMVKEAVGEGSAELLVEEDQEQHGLAAFLRQAIGVAFSVAGEQSMSL